MIKKPVQKIFKDKKSEAEFWDKNFSKAWEKGISSNVKFSKNLSETINVRFDANTLTKIGSEAKKKGLGTTQLIRMWVMERLSA